MRAAILSAVLAGLVTAGAARGADVKHGFFEKLIQDEKGLPHSYVVFIPQSYDGVKPLPLILFLHGAGETGTDNKFQLAVGIGPVVRKQEKTFPFIVVFPQSEKRTWQADSSDGKAAMAI